MTLLAAQPGMHPVLRRFEALARLDKIAIDTVAGALAQARSVPARREIQTEGRPAPSAQIVVGGWAARVRLFRDGRRQFLSFLLPGDVIGLCEQSNPCAISTVVTLTAVELCPAPSAIEAPALAEVYAVSRALHEAYLLEQIVRLGRLTALERIVSLLLELYERLTMAGMGRDGKLDIPLTQEMLGDALGLTSVHVNRMLQRARASGDLHWQAGHVTLTNPADLARWIGRRPITVTAG